MPRCCTGCVSANTRPHQLNWGDREVGTAILCTNMQSESWPYSIVRQWRSQSSAITGADCGRGHVLLQVNFHPGFEYLGLIFSAEVDEAKNRR